MFEIIDKIPTAWQGLMFLGILLIPTLFLMAGAIKEDRRKEKEDD